jgi:hypothetical protein
MSARNHTRTRTQSRPRTRTHSRAECLRSLVVMSVSLDALDAALDTITTYQELPEQIRHDWESHVMLCSEALGRIESHLMPRSRRRGNQQSEAEMTAGI